MNYSHETPSGNKRRTDAQKKTVSSRRQRPADMQKKAASSENRRPADMQRKAASSEVRKKKRVLTPEEKQLREARRARKRAEEEAAKFSSLKAQAVDKNKSRKARQQARARKRKIQLITRLLVSVAVLIAAVLAVLTFSRIAKQKQLEPEGGAGTNILQAAEEANGKNPGGPANTGSISPEGDTGTSANTDALQAGQTTDSKKAGDPNGQAATATDGNGDLSLCMIGDVILHQRVLDASATGNGYDFNNLFANITDEVNTYDIKIVNQETILGGPALEYTGYPAFNSPFEEADALVNAGFNVVLQATNHTLDKGQPAVQNCLNYWNTTYPDIAVLGIHDSMEPSQDLYVFEKNGIRVAILNYTYGSNQYTEEIASGELAGEVDILDPEKVYSDIQKAKEVADYIVVCPHWGVENEHEINSEQVNWTESFLKWGVDLVIGTHSHVIQPIEMLTGSDGHQMLVYYSLGNFLSNQAERAGNVGGFAQVVIGKNDQGQVVTKEYGIRPVVCHEGDDGESYTTYFLDEYTEDMAARNNVLSSDPEFSYSYCYEITQQVFGGIGKLG